MLLKYCFFTTTNYFFNKGNAHYVLNFPAKPKKLNTVFYFEKFNGVVSIIYIIICFLRI